MPSYDFHQLSPYDLEVLARDLLQANWGVTIESFKTGKDGGIDFRYATGGCKIIVQVKHYLKTGLAGLLRDLGKEAGKVHRLNPERYILVTSVPLSAANKKDIVDIIGERLLKPHDVLGQDDLNNLLGKHPHIEGKHYKLWLASRAVLDRVLQNAAVTRSEFKADQVHNASRRYVSSSAYPQALEILKKQNVVIIAGPPGVGKSTLANLLLYEHLASGYQTVLIQRDIVEGENLFQKGVKQVFYFDDFMGSTFLGDQSAASPGTNDRALLDFIAMVRATPSARMILTTREHIYSQAMERSERLRHSDLDDLRVFLRLPSYTFTQKARILYNHLYFSDLPDTYRDELLRNDFYLRIIKHQKFNPRLIEWLSSYRRLRTVPVCQYQHFVEALLQNPSEIWRHAYEREITDAGRSLLLALFSLGGRIDDASLKAAFLALHQQRSASYGFQSRPEDYPSARRELAGAFIKPFGKDGIEAADPSVLDLLNAVVSTAPENAVDIMTAAASFGQIDRVWSFAKSEKGSSLMEPLQRSADKIAHNISRHMHKARRVDLGGGTLAYRGLPFENRLAMVIEMAQRLFRPAYAALILPLFARMEQEWRSDTPSIKGAIELLRLLEETNIMSPGDLSLMTGKIRTALYDEVRTGCGSDELRDLISLIDTSNRSDPAVVAARSGFEHYRRAMFAEELHDCRSREQFEGLIEDLELFREEINVNVSELLDRVEAARTEFQEHEEAYADQMYDEWKERQQEERADERSVTEMFGSLSGDRS